MTRRDGGSEQPSRKVPSSVDKLKQADRDRARRESDVFDASDQCNP